jgi:hypothetical protein
MGPGMFDDMITGLLVLGALIGLCVAGLLLGAFWLFSHLDISIAWV